MRVRLIAVGQRMPEWVRVAVDDYVRRLPREWRFELVEVAAGAGGRNANPERARALEAERLARALPARAYTIAFDERGKALDTVEWSRAVAGWQRDGREVALVIGGPEGLEPSFVQRAHERWSLSRLTLPHPLVRIVVAEQLYRAASLLAGHPYHRA